MSEHLLRTVGGELGLRGFGSWNLRRWGKVEWRFESVEWEKPKGERQGVMRMRVGRTVIPFVASGVGVFGVSLEEFKENEMEGFMEAELD